MAFSLSPGVSISEVDLTTSIPATATSVGAYAGNYRWGPVNEVVTISNENQLLEIFSRPDTNTYVSFFSAANFLSYSNNMKVVRALGTNQRTAATLDFEVGGGTPPARSTSASSISIRNDFDYANNFSAGISPANNSGPFCARHMGALGNSIRYSMCDANTTTFNSWAYKSFFPTAPSNSAFARARSISFDELHIIVLDALGQISGTPNTVLEKFSYTSRHTAAKSENGTSNYYKDVINQSSKYLRWIGDPRYGQLTGSNVGSNRSNVYSSSNTTSGFVFPTSNSALTVLLNGGTDDAPNTSSIIAAYGLMVNPDEHDIGLVITGDCAESIQSELIGDFETRKDCIVFVSPQLTDVVDVASGQTTNIIGSRNTIGSASSYAFMDSGWKYQYDKYNDVYRWMPLNPDVAGLCARTDKEKDPWFSPGGLNRGYIKNIVRLAYNPSQADRDLLYNAQVNPVITISGVGTVLFGDKTMLEKPSAFDRINVRRLFIILQKAIANASKYSLFEVNDSFTRSQFINLVEPYLRDIQGRRGITDFRVICDESNNTKEVVDRNEFVGDIYIKPSRSINYIQLNFIAARTGVAFEEVVGRF